MVCTLCQTHAVPRPDCAFDADGVFTQGNWACGTMLQLRELSQRGGHGDFHSREDLGAGSVGVVHVPEWDSSGFYIFMTWYKSRGQTDSAFFGGLTTSADIETSGPLTLAVAEIALRAIEDAGNTW